MNRPPEPSAQAFSNAVRLSLREWIGIGLFTLALVLGAPSLWQRVENFEPGPDYRIPYELSADYWLYERYACLAAARCDTLVLGDSVVWGEYVTPSQTLAHYLNERAGSARFANLGLDGAYPAALSGLVEHYASDVRGKTVLLQWNALWMSSPRRDLQDPKSDDLNHLRLVPQFVPRIPAYKAEISMRLGVMVEEHVPFNSWTNHLQQAYFDQTDIPSWTLAHPYDNPLENLTRRLPAPDDRLRYEPVSWTQRGIQKQDYDWVDPETSLQWRLFQRTVEILESRKNRVVVLVGPFNEHLLSEKGLQGFRKIKAAVEDWLQERGTEYLVPPLLPSPEYADASHPLAPGYARLAGEIIGKLRR
jgi:hypothetical protein